MNDTLMSYDDAVRLARQYDSRHDDYWDVQARLDEARKLHGPRSPEVAALGDELDQVEARLNRVGARIAKLIMSRTEWGRAGHPGDQAIHLDGRLFYLDGDGELKLIHDFNFVDLDRDDLMDPVPEPA